MNSATTAVMISPARGFRDEGWLPDFPVEEVAADFGGYVQQVLAEGHNRAFR